MRQSIISRSSCPAPTACDWRRHLYLGLLAIPEPHTGRLKRTRTRTHQTPQFSGSMARNLRIMTMWGTPNNLRTSSGVSSAERGDHKSHLNSSTGNTTLNGLQYFPVSTESFALCSHFLITYLRVVPSNYSHTGRLHVVTPGMVDELENIAKANFTRGTMCT